MQVLVPLVQLPIFQESVLEGEALLLSLAPLLEVEVDVGALKQKNGQRVKRGSRINK